MLRNVPIPHFREMAFKYKLVELATAVKPFVFEFLSRRFTNRQLVYLDPDVRVYDRLEPVFRALETGDIALTPHLLHFGPAGAGTKGERDFLRNGAFNLGFIGIRQSEGAKAFLQWWGSRTGAWCYAEAEEGLFTDQRWLDLVCGFSGLSVVILRDPGCNAAHWNMHERLLTRVDGHYLVDGTPLRFYHFSGFDPARPSNLTGTAREPRLETAAYELYRHLFAEYARELNSHAVVEEPYHYDRFVNGEAIQPLHRRLFRLVRERGISFSSDPFSIDRGSFYDLLRVNGLLYRTQEVESERLASVGNAVTKWRLAAGALRVLKKIVGIRAYERGLRAARYASAPENRLHLFGKMPRMPQGPERL